jgi:hypothetical protein
MIEAGPVERLPESFAEFSEKYSALRRRLISMFRRRGVPDPEFLADRALFILFGRIVEGVPMTAGIEAYCYGIARFVLLEQAREHYTGELYDNIPAPVGEGLPSRLSLADAPILLDQCAAAVTPEELALWRRYHYDDRRALARELRITENALRIRVHRINRLMIEAGQKTVTGKSAK